MKRVSDEEIVYRVHDKEVVRRQLPGGKKYLFIAIALITLLFYGPRFVNKIKTVLSEQAQDNATVTIQKPVKQAPLQESTATIQKKQISQPVEATSGRNKPDIPAGPGVINISISSDGFRVAKQSSTFSSSPLNIQLSKDRFSDFIAEPEYTGNEQWYGYMDLGNRKDKRFNFVLDLQADNKFLMYFDSNNNGDLSDDGEPLVNKGSGAGGPGGFACELAIPWQVLIENAPFEGDFKIWLFSNEAGWKKDNRVSHYSHTQLEGAITIGNGRYIAMLIDQGYNDADLSNDGIALDLNQNGKIDREERPASFHVINSQKYTFNISW